MSEMFCAARKEQKSKCIFAYSGEYLNGKKLFQNSNNSGFGIFKEFYSYKLKKL